MDVSYELHVRHEVYHTLRSISRRHRERIVSFVESLPADPLQNGDFKESDRTGRSWEVVIIGKYAVYFWADHAAKDVRVVDLVDADRT